jgi:hypothetical protein
MGPQPTAERCLVKGMLSIAAAGLLLGCGAEALAERDPAGAEACEKLAFALERENEVIYLGALLGAGDIARLADSQAIQDSAEEVAGTGKWLADAEKLHAACEDEGVDMPALRDKG